MASAWRRKRPASAPSSPPRAGVTAQGWTLIGEYSDIASGKDDRRPGFESALARCRQLGAALVAARARGAVLGGETGAIPALSGPDAAAAARVRRDAADQAAHRLLLEVAPRGGAVWTHTTVARVLSRVVSEPGPVVAPVGYEAGPGTISATVGK